MNSLFRKATVLMLTAALGCSALTGCGAGKKETAVDGTKTLFTVGDEEVSLGTAAFFTRYQQAQITQIYQMYFGMSNIFDTVEDEETGETYGDMFRENYLSDLESLVVMRQHASEFGVEISEEQKSAIREAAKAYIENNSEETRAKIGASEEDVINVMELQTIRSLLLDPVAKDVDTEIPYEDIQQTSLTYVEVAVPETLPAESDAESAAEAVMSEAVSFAEALPDTESMVTDTFSAASTSAAGTESVSSAVMTESGAAEAEEAASAAESVAEPLYEEPAPELQAYAEAKAQKVLDLLLASPGMDLNDAAGAVDKELLVEAGHFTTNAPEDGTVDLMVAEACAGLSDGELVDHVIKSEDGSAYYVARVKLVNDEEVSEEKRLDEIRERKQSHFDELTEEWKNATEIKVDEEVLKMLTLTDSEVFTLKAPEASESGTESAAGAEPVEEETFSGTESVLSAAEAVAE